MSWSPSSPKAAISALNVTTAGPTGYRFNVTYTDKVGVLLSSVTGRPVYVKGPNGYLAYARPQSFNRSTNGSPTTVNYRITPPSGSWISADNGVYEISLSKNTVSDVNGNFTPGELLGSFTVYIPAAANPAVSREVSVALQNTSSFALHPLITADYEWLDAIDDVSKTLA
jgi:hypothetical protein